MIMSWQIVVVFLIIGMHETRARPQVSLEYKPNRPFYAGSKPIGVPDQLVPPQVPEDVPIINDKVSSTLKSTTVIENRVQELESTVPDKMSTEIFSSSTTIGSTSTSTVQSSSELPTTEISTETKDSSTETNDGTTGTKDISTESTTLIENAVSTTLDPQISLSTSKITVQSSTEAVTQMVPQFTSISDILYTSASKDKPLNGDKVESSTLASTISGTTANCDCKRQEIVITIKHVHEYMPTSQKEDAAIDKVPPKWPITTQSILPQFNLFWDKWGAAPTFNAHHKHRYYYYRPPY